MSINHAKHFQAKQLKVRPRHWVLFFSLVGFGLRVHQLSFQPLWGDEGWSFYLAGQSWPDLLALTAIDIHPPLYYILLKGWLFTVGSGAEEARFLSVVIGTALIPVMGMLARSLFNRQVGAMAAAVVTLMPLAIYYSQEVRMYGLVTLLGTISVYFLLKALHIHQGPSLPAQPTHQAQATSDKRPSKSENEKRQRLNKLFAGQIATQKKWFIGYLLATTAALYTHYYAIFIPLFQLFYLLLTHLRRQGNLRHLTNRAILRPLIYVGLLYLPWLIYAGPRLVSYIDNKRVVEGYTPLNFTRFFSHHLVAFSLGHIPPVLAEYMWMAIPFIIFALLGLIAALWLNRWRYLYLALYLVLPLLAGYAINQIYPFTPPYFERTLLLAAPPYWLFMAAGLSWLWDRLRLLTGAIVIAMLLIISLSLTGFYTLPRYPNEDYRPLLKDIAARATPADTLLASYQWQLGFYQAYLPPPRPRLFAVPGWGSDWAGAAGHAQLIRDLSEIFSRSPRLWFPAYQAQGHLWEDEAEAAIATMGYPALLQWHGPQTKLTLAATSQAALVQAPTANFENRLFLQKARVGNEQYEAGRGIVPVELSWQKLANLGSEHRLNLRLADAGGRTWASRDTLPRAGQASFTDLDIGDTLLDRHGLLIPAGTPPGLYRLLLSVRRVSDARPLDLVDNEGQPQGAELLLGQVEVTVPNPPVGPAALPVQVAVGADFERAIRLVGYSLGTEPFKAGQALPLNLFWESLIDFPGSVNVIIQLQDETGQPVVRHEQAPIWPASQWRHGSLLRDPHDLILPPGLPPGPYQLVIGLVNEAGTPLKVEDRDQLQLTQVTTVDRPHSFAAPRPQIPLTVTFSDQAKLVGLDLPRQVVQAGEPLPLTLYWQASAPFDKSWTVFVHLIDKKGRIVGQQDQIPGGGQFPTTGWLPNEYLADSYNLPIPADTPPGRQVYWLEIGLYDPNDFSRLPVTEAGKIIGDHIVLERWPISIE